MRKSILFAALATSAAVAAPANAAIVVLDFENIGVYPNDNIQVLDYYNGGTSSIGTSGTNYGVSFGSNAETLCFVTPGGGCGTNTSRGGVGDPASQFAGLFFLSGSETFLNFAAGFTTGFSFNYAAAFQAGSVGVYDGLNGTGNLLATILLPVNTAGCGADFSFVDFCPFGPAGVAFGGTARSIAFGGVANQIVFDDITFGSDRPGPGAVPEPATWAMMLVGFGAAGAALRRGRRRRSRELALA